MSAKNRLVALQTRAGHAACNAAQPSSAAVAGPPPHAWLTRRRIEQAQKLMLAHKEMGLVEVALSVGYASQTAFGAACKRVVGATPTEWRQEQAG